MTQIEPEAEHSQDDIRIAWQKFVKNEPIQEGCVPPHILRGWQTSKKFEVDPFHPQVPPVLDKNDFLTICEKHQDLLQSAEHMMDMLAVSIRDKGYIATLAVATGHLLAVVGDGELLGQAYARYNSPGAVRSIRNVGVSALSLCMSEKRPIMVTGYEHYNSSFHDWCCAAAPIFDVDGIPIASLTISSHISQRDTHTLTLATSCAHGISVHLREKALMQTQQHLNALLESVHNALPEAIVAFDQEGLVTHANDKAMTLFKHVHPLTGCEMKKLISTPDQPRVQHLLNIGQQGTLELEVLTCDGPTNHICRFVPIVLEDGSTCGITASFSSRRQLMDIAKHVGGNYAKYSFDDIKGESALFKEQIAFAKRAAQSDFKILITGESGTGKELFAQSIHNSSRMHNGPFVGISCAAIPRDLIESELFGYVGGAFTGARRNGMIGKMELATGGTLFLDEINSLPLEMQVKLLRVLQQMEIVRIGDTKPTPINARIIAATNQDLREAVHQGTFREDLFFRLNVVELVIPPLRDRKDDIGLLAHIFLRRQAYESHMPFQRIAGDAMNALFSYDWPGNVRELENVCERALLMSDDGIITSRHLPPHLDPQQAAAPTPLMTSLPPMASMTTQLPEPNKPSTSGMSKAPLPVAASGEPWEFGQLEHHGQHGHSGELKVGDNIQDAYRKLIIETLTSCQGNISRTAEQLGIARSTLYRKMKQFKISL